MPLVSSYTWMIVFSPTIWMTSPRSCSSPTNCTSYMRGRRPVAVTTGPATRKISPDALPAAAFSFPFIAMLVPPPQVLDYLYRSTPIARLIFARRSSSSRLPTAMTTGRGVVSSRRRIVLLRAVMSSALRIRIPTFGSSRTFATCASTPSRPTLNVFRTPASLNPWTNSSRPTAASSILHHQELPNGFGRQRALLPPRDDSKVLDLPLLAHNVIEDWQDRQRVDVRIVPRLEQVELFDRAHELTNPERLQVLEAGGQVLGERIVPQPSGECVEIHLNHFGQLLLPGLQAARDERVVWEARLRGPEPQEGLEIHNIDFAADELSHQAGPFRPLRNDEEKTLVVTLSHVVLPLVPPLDLRGSLAEGCERLRVNGAFQPIEDLV